MTKATSHDAPCPSCGYCPTCGRKSAAPAWPYGPVWVYPTYYPYTVGDFPPFQYTTGIYPTTITVSGNAATISANSTLA